MTIKQTHIAIPYKPGTVYLQRTGLFNASDNPLSETEKVILYQQDEIDRLNAELAMLRESWGLEPHQVVVQCTGYNALLIDGKGGSRERRSITTQEVIDLKARIAELEAKQ